MPGYEFIDKEEIKAVTEVFTKNNGYLYRYGKGHFVKDFEEAFAKHFKVKYAHAVSSGSAALKLSLQALGVKPGDEVITQCHTFVATVEAIVECGATPVVVDINKSLNMDPMELKKAITSKTKVVIPVHMSGVPCNMKYINEVLEGTNIKILEDNAQSPGATYRGRYTGTFGAAGIFSFDYGKMMTTGEGGCILTNNENIYNIIRGLSDHGHKFLNVSRGLDDCIGVGFNYKMNEIQGAIGLVQLKKLDTIIAAHRKNKKLFLEQLEDLNLDLRYVSDKEGDIGDSVTFFLPTKEKAQKFVKEWQKHNLPLKNIPLAMKWHFAGYWNHINYVSNGLKYSWELLERTVEIPIKAKYIKGEMLYQIKVLRELTKKLT